MQGAALNEVELSSRGDVGRVGTKHHRALTVIFQNILK